MCAQTVQEILGMMKNYCCGKVQDYLIGHIH